MILSKQILKVGLSTLLSLNVVHAKRYKSHISEVRTKSCLKARASKYAIESLASLACGVFGPVGLGVCGATAIAVGHKIDETLDKKLEGALCD